MTEWTKEHDALIEATEQHQLEEQEEKEAEKAAAYLHDEFFGPLTEKQKLAKQQQQREEEVQERLEAMKKVVLAARANLAAFESAYNELSELLGSESQV